MANVAVSSFKQLGSDYMWSNCTGAPKPVHQPKNQGQKPPPSPVLPSTFGSQSAFTERPRLGQEVGWERPVLDSGSRDKRSSQLQSRKKWPVATLAPKPAVTVLQSGSWSNGKLLQLHLQEAFQTAPGPRPPSADNRPGVKEELQAGTGVCLSPSTSSIHLQSGTTRTTSNVQDVHVSSEAMEPHFLRLKQELKEHTNPGKNPALSWLSGTVSLAANPAIHTSLQQQQQHQQQQQQIFASTDKHLSSGGKRVLCRRQKTAQQKKADHASREKQRVQDRRQLLQRLVAIVPELERVQRSQSPGERKRRLSTVEILRVTCEYIQQLQGEKETLSSCAALPAKSSPSRPVGHQQEKASLPLPAPGTLSQLPTKADLPEDSTAPASLKVMLSTTAAALADGDVEHGGTLVRTPSSRTVTGTAPSAVYRQADIPYGETYAVDEHICVLESTAFDSGYEVSNDRSAMTSSPDTSWGSGSLPAPVSEENSVGGQWMDGYWDWDVSAVPAAMSVAASQCSTSVSGDSVQSGGTVSPDLFRDEMPGVAFDVSYASEDQQLAEFPPSLQSLASQAGSDEQGQDSSNSFIFSDARTECLTGSDNVAPDFPEFQDWLL